ncbi:EamA family transporter [Rhodobacteraceae bacterium 2CG4]|uniref:EamA family transporter n=1 Tax=Halovulum marinum TaxID=2662447 RepID=A0A6L5Z0L7_9RHOB|nr:EamA family transporter [Halovulum marinum]MSU90103.1 EamA family transporter [Halovulum marinum]
MKQDWIGIGSLALLTVVWGSSFALITVALDGFPPIGVAVFRVLFSALALALLARALGHPLPRDPKIWAWCAAVGLISLLVPFFLIAWGQQSVPSALASIYISASPLFVLLLSRLVLGEQVSARRWAGFAVGFFGIVLLTGPGALTQLGSGNALPQLALLAAAACYAGSSVLIRRMPEVPPIPASAAAQIAAAVFALPLLPMALPEAVPAAGPLLAIAVLGVVQTGLAHVLRYATVRRSGPVFMSTVGYLIPLWATLLGVGLLDETLSGAQLAGFALIVGGLVLARKRRARAAAPA